MIYPPDDRELVERMNRFMRNKERRLPTGQRWRAVRIYVRWYEKFLALILIALAFVGGISLLLRW